MNDTSWAHQSPPRSGPDGTPLLRAAPATAAELTALRQRLRTALLDGVLRPEADEAAIDRLLLVFEELVSNGLRHGRRPVRVAVTATDTGWLLEVSDGDPHHPPTPAVGRDAARGGLGLLLVARLAGGHGWTVDSDGRKTVWACVEYLARDSFGSEVATP